jgi:DNA-binding transcriptional ArsR family regulator
MSACPVPSIMDKCGHMDISVEASVKALSRFNLKENPFQVFELFEQGSDQKSLERDESLFRDRKEIVEKICNGISLSKSYRVVLHGDVGVGKSSLLNRILYILSNNKYFTIKYRVPEEIKDAKSVEREFLRAFGLAISSEALHNSSMLATLKNLLARKLSANKSLEEISFLAILYASEQITLTNGAIQTQGLSTTVGIPIIKAEVSKEEQEQILVARTETLSHTVFVSLLKRGFALLRTLGYRGIVIGLDELDKLESAQLEKTMMTLFKDVFYTNANLAHVIIVLKQRNGLKPVHPDIFHYEQIFAPRQGDVIAFLSQMYSNAAIDPGLPIYKFADKKLLSEVYEKNEGRLRFILEELSNLLLSTLPRQEIKKLDLTVYKEITLDEAEQSYLKILNPGDIEYKILKYLFQRGETYARDEDLSKATNVKKSALSGHLKALQERSILATKDKGKSKIYFIDPRLKHTVEEMF